MAKAKTLAHGTTVLNNTTTLTLVGSIDPPARSREKITARDMTDDFDVPLLGIEEESEWSMMQYHDPGDSEDTAFDAAFNSKAELTMKIVTTHSTPKTIGWPSKVRELAVQSLAPDGTYQRQITFLRTGDSTLA